jgi:hypothetical protein
MVELHDTLAFAFDPGLRFASNGVVARPGHTFEHLWLAPHLEFDEGCRFLGRHLTGLGLTPTALVGMDVRLPATLSLKDFVSFNDHYLAQLDTWGLLRDGISPLARTNVSPTHGSPQEPDLAGFSYVVPEGNTHLSYVISGIAEIPVGGAYPDDIVSRGDTTAGALVKKANTIVDVLEIRAATLAVTWEASDTVHLYSAHDLAYRVSREVLGARGHAPADGLVWFDAAPPVVGLELELDIRRYEASWTSRADA